MRISLPEAILAIQRGQVIAVPTETVYGLAASLLHETAIRDIFSLKGRPAANPLIIHVANLNQVKEYAQQLPPGFADLAQHFWPGPMTLVLPVYLEKVPSIVRSGLSTAGFRVPRHELALQLLSTVGPLVMPSANLSGRPSATTASHVEEDFGEDFPLLDGGSCQKGVESTILYYRDTEWVILRLGSFEPEVFQHVLGYQPRVIHADSSSNPLCPGQAFRHYAPRAKLLLGEATRLNEASFVLGFKERNYPKDKRLICMGSLNDPHKVAENLYGALRQLDQEGADLAWIDMDFPCHGLWMTIAERLQRAGND